VGVSILRSTPNCYYGPLGSTYLKTAFSLYFIQDYIDAALCAILQINEDSEAGDVLCFLPGQDEIESLLALLKSHLDDTANLAKSLTGDVVQSLKGIGTDLSKTANIINRVLVCVLYAALPPEQQMFAFQPKPEGCSRKVILSTNISGKKRSWHIISLLKFTHVSEQLFNVTTAMFSVTM